MKEDAQNSNHPRTRPWQFSLRSLFVLTTIVAVLSAIAATSPPSFSIVLAVCYVVTVFLFVLLAVSSVSLAVAVFVSWIVRPMSKNGKDPRYPPGR
jgi:hypothetical protein